MPFKLYEASFASSSLYLKGNSLIILLKSLENLLKKSTKHKEAVEDDYKKRRIKISFICFREGL